MARLVRLELNKALRNPWFVIALFVTCALAVASSALTLQGVYETYNLKGGFEKEYLSLSMYSSFGLSLPVANDAASVAFYYLCPLLVLVPYATSLRSELVDGVLAQAYTRSPRAHYLAAKACAAFVSGSLIVAIPLVLNLLVLSCFMPGYTPEALDGLHLGINPGEAFARLFYEAPVAYALVNTLTCGALYGTWAVCVLAVSAFVDNRVILLAGSYLFVLGVGYASGLLFSALRTTAVRLSLTELAKGASYDPRDPRGLLFALLLQAVFGLLVIRGIRKRDVL